MANLAAVISLAAVMVVTANAALVLSNRPRITPNRVHKVCSKRFGPNYRFVPSDFGFLVGEFEDRFGVTEVDNARIVTGVPGQRCGADRVLACNANETDCQKLVLCEDFTSNRCLDCQRVTSIVTSFTTRTGIYADCDEGTIGVEDMSKKQLRQVLEALKDNIVGDCELKGCRYWTELVKRVKVVTSKQRLGVPTQTKRAKRKLRRCPSLQQVQFADNGCRFSTKPLPTFTPPPPSPEPSCTRTYERRCRIFTSPFLSPNPFILGPSVVDCDRRLDGELPCSPLPTDSAVVSLIGNALTSLPGDTLSQVEGLAVFDISVNNLTELFPNTFDGQSDLELLYIDDNFLTSFPDGIFDDLSNLTLLQSDFNQLQTLSANLFQGLTALIDLDMDHNMLEALPAGLLDPLTQLEQLDFNDNPIASLPAGIFDTLTKLEDLELHEMLLTELDPDIFANNGQIDRIHLGYNQLLELSNKTFSGLTLMTELRLDHNNLSSLPEGLFSDLVALKTLELEDNMLSTLPDGIFDAFSSSITELTMEDNPWICCGPTREALLLATDNPICAGPPDVAAQAPGVTDTAGCI
eukprot:m.58887 g.58887  ORF g.58887 m.58887 type:complete len:578 (-) comp13800_c1_seq1:111-1844(-)